MVPPGKKKKKKKKVRIGGPQHNPNDKTLQSRWGPSNVSVFEKKKRKKSCAFERTKPHGTPPNGARPLLSIFQLVQVQGYIEVTSSPTTKKRGGGKSWLPKLPISPQKDLNFKVISRHKKILQE